MKVGTRLLRERQDRKLSQADMADMIGVTPPTYSRLERNETSIDMDKVVDIAKKLNIPIQEFLPETITINSSNQNGHIGLVLGNVYHYSDKETNQILMEKEMELSREKIIFLENKIKDLETIIELMKRQ